MGAAVQHCCGQPKVDETAIDLSIKPAQKKLRPLLCDLEEDFKAFCGDDNLLDRRELASIWKACAEKKVGVLSEEDIRLIDDSCQVYFSQMDVDASGRIGYEEFVTFMMGGTEDRGACRQFRQDLNKELSKDPKCMERLVRHFKSIDTNGDGHVSQEEIDVFVEDVYMDAHEWKIDHTNSRAMMRKQGSLDHVTEDFIKEADVDGDGKVDMWEFIAYSLGRRKSPVEILLYNVGGKIGDKLGPLLMGQKVELLHTAVVVFGREFWYGGNLFINDPPYEKQFGKPMEQPWGARPLPRSEYKPELPVIKAGYTFLTEKEFRMWLQSIAEDWKGRDSYDLLTHSCNHFTEKVIKYLTGNEIPDKILELQKSIMNPTVMKLRPILNKYLNCFNDKRSNEELLGKWAEPPIDEKTGTDLCQSVLGTGAVVNVQIDDQDVIGVVTAEEGDTCQVRFFDAATGHVATKSVKKAMVRKS